MPLTDFNLIILNICGNLMIAPPKTREYPKSLIAV
jgi:hypothetical protein